MLGYFIDKISTNIFYLLILFNKLQLYLKNNKTDTRYGLKIKS